MQRGLGGSLKDATGKQDNQNLTSLFPSLLYDHSRRKFHESLTKSTWAKGVTCEQ